VNRTPSRIQPACIAAVVAAILGLGAASTAEAETRAFRQAFPVTAGAELRLANLAGTVELVRGQEAQVVVEATVHAEGTSAAETQQLLQATARWVPARDGKGREEWALAYPVEKFHSFYYPRPGQHDEGFWSFFDNGYSSTTYRGEKVRIYKQQRSSAPLLYADLKIYLPGGAALAVRDVVGAVRGGALDGTLSVDTGSGDIRLDSFAGRLKLNTGSGDIRLGQARGETAIGTGSGDLVVRELVGNGTVDTGSGDVVIDKVSAGKLAIDTGSGNVTVRSGVASRLTADTGSGDVHVVGVELEELVADTGSGNVEVVSSLANARKLTIKTGSGDVRLTAGAQAAFDISADQGSGDLTVGYADAVLRRAHHRDKVIGARRGDGRTVIHLETGSGDCVIKPGN
jgi:DUF4097 and DUF4098 domain-containing protein YvlB